MFLNDTATTDIYTLSLHDALPISVAPLKKEHEETARMQRRRFMSWAALATGLPPVWAQGYPERPVKIYQGFAPDRKSTRLNSSHSQISYACFWLQRKHGSADGHLY